MRVEFCSPELCPTRLLYAEEDAIGEVAADGSTAEDENVVADENAVEDSATAEEKTSLQTAIEEDFYVWKEPCEKAVSPGSLLRRRNPLDFCHGK